MPQTLSTKPSYLERLQHPGAVLAPMAGYSDAPFRQLARRYGALWAVSEMLSAKGVLEGGSKTLELGQPYPGEDHLVIQLFGADTLEVGAAAAEVERLYHPQGLELNMGCPVPKMRGRGGSCLLQTPELAAEIVSSMVRHTSVPISAKMRLGWDTNRALEIALALEGAGAALITVHGRTKAQRYEGKADWDAVGAVASSLKIPVLLSGDVGSVQGARAALALGVAGVMVGRGAVGNPFLFREIAGGKPATPLERLKVALEHAELNVQWYGELRGLRQLRKVLIGYVADFPDLVEQVKRIDTLEGLRAALELAN